MKKLILGVALLLVACAKAPAPKMAFPVSADDCGHIYLRWLAIGAVAEYGADPTSEPEMTTGIQMLSEEFSKNGIANKFYSSCINTMNTVQADCMMRANSFNELHICTRMYANK